MQIILEHINVTLNDIDAAAKNLENIFDWRIRWVGPAKDDGRTIHIGGKNSYLALYSPVDSRQASSSHKVIGNLNHVGIVVDDIDAIEFKVKTAGFKPYNHGDYEPGRRFYFDLEPDMEIEVVSYQ